MKLFCGNIAKIGDRVGFILKKNPAADIECGIVTGFTKQMVTVMYYNKHTNNTTVSSRMPHNMVKVYQD